MRKLLSYSILLILLLSACSVIKTVRNIARLKYSLLSVSDFRLAGIQLENKRSLNDFSSLDALKITASAIKGTMPLTFILNVEAKNPNDGKDGSSQADLTIQSFPWRLLINDKEVVSGNVSKPILVPGIGKSTIIPIEINFDVAKNLKEKNINDIIDLGLKLGGTAKSVSNLKLKVKPVIGTPVGNMQYPNEITIVDNTFN